MPTDTPYAATLARIEAARFVPVIRAESAELAILAGRALAAGGCSVLEVSFTTPEACEAIHALVHDGLFVGAGTVLDDEMAADAVFAGASFLVSPVLDRQVMEFADSTGVLAIPGALTPSEVWAAHRAGATIVKIFPIASVGGPRYLGLLRDPLPAIRFLPTGGVTLDQVPAYMAHGAIAVGVSSALVSRSALEQGDAAAIEAAARHWVEALMPVR